MKPHIVIVDDTPRFLAGLLKALAANSDGLVITIIQSASELEDLLPTLAKEPPHVFVLDIMLKWSRELRENTSLFKEGFYPLDGGFFVANAIRQASGLAQVPLVFYSASPTAKSSGEMYLNKESRDHIYYSSKNESDEQVAKLLISIVAAQVDVQPPKPRGPTFIDALELKPGAFGFRIDLKKLFKQGKSDA